MSLRHAAFSAGRWTGASALIRATLQVVQVMVLARLLLPADFGLMALALAAFAIVALFADMGISRAIIHFDDIDERSYASLYWSNVVIALSLAALLACSAPLLARLYGEPALLPVILGICPVLPLSALGQQFIVRAEKEMRFAVAAQNEVLAALVGFATAVGLALAGWGVGALVAGALATALGGSLLAIWRLAGWCIPRPRLSPGDVRPYLGYGLYSVGDTLVSTATRESDVFIGGLFATPAGVGLYSIPRDLSLRVALLLNPITTRVGFPVMSRVKADPDALRAVYRETLRFTASLNFPLYVAFAVFASELVVVLYGPRWADSAALLRILAAWGLVRSTANPVGSLLYGTGKTRRSFAWNAVLLVVVPAGLWAGARAGGTMGLAYSLLAIQCLLFIPGWYYLVRPSCGMSLRELSGVLLPPLGSSVVAAAIAWLAVDGLDSPLARLLLGGALLAGLYWVGSLAFNPIWTQAVIEAARPVLRRFGFASSKP